MGELHFAPSDAVWPAVEKQIAARKKRRALFIWLPFLLLLPGGAAWLYKGGINKVTTGKNFPVAAANNNEVRKTDDSRQAQIKPRISDTDSLHNQAATEKTNTIISGNDKIGTTNPRNKVSAKTIPPQNEHARSNTASLAANNRRNTADDKKISRDKRLAGQSGTTKTTADNTTALFNNTATKAEGESKTDGSLKETQESLATRKTKSKKEQRAKTITGDEEAVAATTLTEKNDRDSNRAEHVVTGHTKTFDDAPAADTAVTADAPATAKLVIADSVKITNKTDSSAVIGTTSAAVKKTKKIEWGINVSAGVSNISQGFSGVLSATPAYDASAYLNNASNTPGNINNGNNNFSAPSSVKPGFAYAANIFLSKPLAKKLQLRAGIGYSYFSNRIEVGAKIDSNKALVQYDAVRSSGFGASSVINNYTNRFHFIQLPVTIEQQVGNAGHFSVNGGLAFSWLASSNVLLYDKTKRIYYSDKSQLNKMQLSLLAGFSYRVFSKSFVIETGPQVNYGLSNIFKKELYGSRHLFFAGLHASIFFHKKK